MGTPLLLLKSWDVWTTNSILCTPRELLFTGMLVKVWKKVNSVKPVKILQPWKKIMKKLLLKPQTTIQKVEKLMNFKYEKNNNDSKKMNDEPTPRPRRQEKNNKENEKKKKKKKKKKKS